MRSYYFTMTRDHAQRNLLGNESGYVEVRAENADQARERIWSTYGPVWSMQYAELDLIHELDRKKLKVLT